MVLYWCITTHSLLFFSFVPSIADALRNIIKENSNSNPCYVQGVKAPINSNYNFRIEVTVDATGKMKTIKFDAATQNKMRKDQAYRKFVESSKEILLNPTCLK